MLPPPAIAPMVGFQTRILLGRDYYVRVHGNDYSVDPSGIGRMVDISADLHQVAVRLDGVLLAIIHWAPCACRCEEQGRE